MMQPVNRGHFLLCNECRQLSALLTFIFVWRRGRRLGLRYCLPCRNGMPWRKQFFLVFLLSLFSWTCPYTTLFSDVHEIPYIINVQPCGNEVELWSWQCIVPSPGEPAIFSTFSATLGQQFFWCALLSLPCYLQHHLLAKKDVKRMLLVDRNKVGGRYICGF